MIFTVTLNPAIDREYTVPNIEFDEVLRATQVRNDPGGKGFNVSRMLKVMGEPSTALGFIGGKSGEWLSERLYDLGIESDFITLPAETRTNTTIVTPQGETHIKVNEPGPTVSIEAQTRLLNQIEQIAQPGDWWVLAGSLPPGVPPNYYGKLIDVIHANAGRVFLDTSGNPLTIGVQHRPDWIKPNEKEAQGLTEAESALEALVAIEKMGLENCVISLGKSGALILTAQERWHLLPPKVKERNPIGAGDAFVGGIVWGLSQGLLPLDAARWGIACGAMAASQPGTGFGSYPDIAELYTQVQLQSAYEMKETE